MHTAETPLWRLGAEVLVRRADERDGAGAGPVTGYVWFESPEGEARYGLSEAQELIDLETFEPTGVTVEDLVPAESADTAALAA